MNDGLDKLSLLFLSILVFALMVSAVIVGVSSDYSGLMISAMITFALAWLLFGFYFGRSSKKTKNNELLATLLEQLHEHIITIRPDGTIVNLDSHNDHAFEGKVLGESIYEAFQLTTKKPLEDAIKSVVKHGDKETIVIKAVHEGNQVGWYEYRISPVWNQHSVELLIIAIHNVTDREKEVKIYEILSSIGTTLISTTDIEIGMKKAAHILSQTIKGGYVFVYQLDALGVHAKNIALEQDGKEIRARRKILGDIFSFSLHDFASIHERLRLKKSFFIDAHDHATEDRFIVKLMRERNIDSLIIIPIIAQGSVIGFFGLAGTKQTSCWRSNDIPRFNLIADILSVFIERQIAVTELGESNRQKTDFISIVSHQLQGPISSIKWNVEMIKDGDAGKPTKKMIEILDNVEEAGEQMKDLVQDLLHVSRIEQGRMNAVVHETDIISLIPSVIAEVDAIAHQKNLSIVIDAPKSAIVSGDQHLLKQILQNLLNNAVKYSHENSQVLLRITKKRQRLQIEVIDEGIGIPKDELQNLFGKFYRASNAREMAVEGSGLGLYVVKSFLEMMRGSIEVHSKLGEGSTFTIYLPLNH